MKTSTFLEESQLHHVLIQTNSTSIVRGTKLMIDSRIKTNRNLEKLKWKHYMSAFKLTTIKLLTASIVLP